MKKIVSLTFILAIMFSLVACEVTFGPTQATVVAPTLTPAASSSSSTSASGSNLSLQQDMLVNLYKQVNPGIVGIITTVSQGMGFGTGFVYDNEGHVITNYHVVQGANSVEVDFPSGLKTTANVIATDSDSDLAVLKVDIAADQLVPLTLGNSDQVQVGETVVAIGNPLGDNGAVLSNTMTAGIVSALGRTMESLHQTSSGDFFSTVGMIQTDATLNPGNSGGPLLDLNGDVIGINRAIETTTSLSTSGEPANVGIGFAIPINIVKQVVPTLIKQGHYDYPYLGASLLDLSLTTMNTLGLKSSNGVYVASLVSGGPADQAGIRAGTQTTSDQGLNAGGDFITAADGHAMDNANALISYLITNKQPGDQVVLTVLRDGKQTEITVTLGRRP
ncbi:MAG TPA: trypsin-like peptidase domain-containing protein [Longilinea sp.]|nr:trypsin-like peptidase domain-containing protein [Longilinea sp.]